MLLKACKGRKFFRKKLAKLKKPISCKKKSIICNNLLSDKNKIRFLTQLFRWFAKDSGFYKIKCDLKKNTKISELDVIHLVVKIQKAGFKNLLLKLNYRLSDYKILKRRSYSLYFKFLFLDLKETKKKEITFDLVSSKFDRYNIFITTNGYFLKEFYNIINVIYKREGEKKKPDDNDILLDSIEYIYTNIRYNEILYHEIYLPWFLKRDDYYVFTAKIFRKERKYNIIIKERKFRGIFPLRNVKGFLVVADQEKAKNEDYKLFEANFESEYYKKQKYFFMDIKKLIDGIKLEYNINPILVYFKIEYLKI